MGSDHAVSARRALKTFGWHGITVTIPADWDLASTRGDHRAGYVRLADKERARLELRWETVDRPAPPFQTVNAYLKKVGKSARKKGFEFSSQRQLHLASPAGKDVECYRWLGERQAVAMLSNCAECGRTVHVHLLGEREEQLKALARTVFASLRDHSDDGTELWQFFDVEFRAPVGLPLKRRILRAGCIRMIFAGRGARLEFVRASLAQVLLADKDVGNWFRGFYDARLRKYAFRAGGERIKGHPGVSVEGRAKILASPLRVLRRTGRLRAACWHCEETNRLMICALEGRRREAEEFPRVLEGFVCCGGR